MPDKYVITINGQVPSKKNSKQIFRNAATGKPFITSSKGFSEWHTSSLWQVKRFARTTGTMKGPLHVMLKFYNSDRRRHDLDNMAASVMDLLVDAGIIADDTCTVVNHLQLIYQGIDKNKPRVVVYLKESDGGTIWQ